jgi:ABC-2 type transport system ATP-binding protein
MRSALGIVIGLAAQAEITLFDEPYAGLDAVSRQLFYDRLLSSYADRPSTVILSTHLIDEVADLLEQVVMIDHGRIVLDASADEVRGSATSVSGPIAAVEEFVAGRRTWDRRRIASQERVVGTIDDGDWVRARELHLNLESLSLQEFMVHAAGRPIDEASERTSARVPM